MGRNTAVNLANWAYGNESRIADLKRWQTEALAAIASGKGRDIANTSANGVSIAFASGMSVADWFNILCLALSILANGTPATTKHAIFE